MIPTYAVIVFAFLASFASWKFAYDAKKSEIRCGTCEFQSATGPILIAVSATVGAVIILMLLVYPPHA